jgi:hypothetical protein
VVSGLVEQENVGLEEHGTSEGELHLPATREGANAVGLALIVEAERLEGLDDLLLLAENTLVVENELENRSVLIRAVNVVLDVEGADLVGRREALNLAILQVNM